MTGTVVQLPPPAMRPREDHLEIAGFMWEAIQEGLCMVGPQHAIACGLTTEAKRAERAVLLQAARRVGKTEARRILRAMAAERAPGRVPPEDAPRAPAPERPSAQLFRWPGPEDFWP